MIVLLRIWKVCSKLKDFKERGNRQNGLDDSNNEKWSVVYSNIMYHKRKEEGMYQKRKVWLLFGLTKWLCHFEDYSVFYKINLTENVIWFQF